MKLFHIHRWTRWSKPFEQPMIARWSGQRFIDHMQRRQCEGCGEIQERTL